MLTDATASYCVTDGTWNGLHKMQLCLTQFWFKLQDSTLCTPSAPLLTRFFVFFGLLLPLLPPPLPLPSYPGLPLFYPPPPYLPLALPPSFPPFLQDGQGRSHNTIWNSETSHSTAGLLLQLLKPLNLRQIRLVLQEEHNIFGKYSSCYNYFHRNTTVYQKLLWKPSCWGPTNQNQRHKNLPRQAGPEPEAKPEPNKYRTRNPVSGSDQARTDQKRPVKISEGHWKSLMGLLTIGKWWRCNCLSLCVGVDLPGTKLGWIWTIHRI